MSNRTKNQRRRSRRGDRVLAKLIDKSFDEFEMAGIRQAVRVIKILPKREDSILGIYRRDPVHGGGRLVPIDKKTQEMPIDDAAQRGTRKKAIWWLFPSQGQDGQKPREPMCAK